MKLAIYCLFSAKNVLKNSITVVLKNVTKSILFHLKIKKNYEKGKRIVIKFLKKEDQRF
jgi:hypothetical protein